MDTAHEVGDKAQTAAAIAKTTAGVTADATKRAVSQAATKASRALETDEQRNRGAWGGWVGMFDAAALCCACCVVCRIMQERYWEVRQSVPLLPPRLSACLGDGGCPAGGSPASCTSSGPGGSSGASKVCTTWRHLAPAADTHLG